MKHRRRRLWRWPRRWSAAAFGLRVFGVAKEVIRGGRAGDAERVDADRGPADGVDLRLLTSTQPMVEEPSEPVWTRLRRGSQWHRREARCAPRSHWADLVYFRGSVAPRAGGYVICLECAQRSGCGEQAAAYVPPRWATPQGLRGAGGSRSGFVASARSPTRQDRSGQERFPAGASCREPMQRLSA